MATKCKIAYQNDGYVECINCANDGSIDKIGKRLLEVYNTPNYIRMIMNRGDLVVLGRNLKKWNKDTNPIGTVDTFQTQNRKINRTKHKDISEILVEETEAKYIYYFKDNEWNVLEVVEDEGKLKPYLGEFRKLNSLLS